MSQRTVAFVFVFFFSPEDLSQYSLTALETLDNRKKLLPLLRARK